MPGHRSRLATTSLRPNLMSSAADATDDQQSAQDSLIERQMPVCEQRILLAQPEDAPTHLAYAAIRRVDFFGSRFITMPHRAREVLEAVRPSPHEVRQGRPKHFRFDQLLEEEGGFHLLAEDPDREIVLGFVGRWWERGYGRVDWSAEEFRDFDRPGFGVGAWNFAVLPYGSRESVLVTEIRLRCTDDEARRAFHRYWFAVAPFVRAMGRPVLRLIRTEAEQSRATASSTN
jgi:hypothetical protein